MGKSNRIRSNRAEVRVVTPATHKKKKGLSLRAKTIIAAVVAIIILSTCVFGILSANGVMMRHRKAIYTDNFKVSGNMLSYYYNTQYQNFTQTYGQYMSSFSLNPKLPLKDQKYGVAATAGGAAYETQILGPFEGTWFDYFMSLAEKQAKQTLVYCEEANARDIVLTDEDFEKIDSNIEMMKAAASQYGYTANSYTSNLYGKGVHVNDVKKAMELSVLAEKCMNTLEDEILDAIKDGDIDAAYNKDKLKFNLIDYSYYTFKVNYDDVAKEVLGKDYTEAELKEKKDEVLTAYKEKIEEAKQVADALKDKKTVEEFNDYIYNYVANDKYDTLYKDIKVEADKIPSADDVKAIKEAMIADVLKDFKDEKEATEKAYTEKDGVYTMYEKTVTKEFAEAMDKLKTDVFGGVKSDKEKYVLEKVGYQKDNEFSEWAFEDGRAINEIKTILTGDGSKEDKEIDNDDGHFYYSVYFLTKPQYCDESLTKDVAWMIFGDEAKAKEAIEAIKAEGISLEKFKEIATSKGAAAHQEVEDYVAGSIGIEGFEKWLKKDETTVGSFTVEPIKVDDKTFMVAYYYGEGEPNWKVSVKASVFSERFEEYFKGMESKYTVTVKDSVVNNIG